MNQPDSKAAHREQVYEAFADRRQSLAAAVEAALEAGVGRLGVGIGFLTRIEDGTQYIEHAVGDHAAIQAGEQCPLDEAYCRRTVQLDGHLSVQDATSSAEVPQQAYEAFGLGSYIGCKIVVDEDVYGTVCFADQEPRERPFSEAEELFVELVARLAGRAIERRAYEREQAERTAQIETEKRRFEGIAENSFDVLYRIDTDGELTYVSQAVERVLGYEPDELVGDNFATLVSDGTTPSALSAFTRLLDGETVQGLEIAFTHRDGHQVSMEVNATPITDDDAVTAVQGVGRDITERKERESELRLRTRAMDAAEVPITMADATARDNPIVYANDAFETVTGYSKGQIIGNNCRILQGPGTDDEGVRTLREGIDAQRPVTAQILNYRRDGTPFWNRITVTPIADDTGTVTHYLGFQQDVTEQQRITRLVELLNRVLRHNLRNELTVIEGYTDFIHESPEGMDIQAKIRRPLRRLVSLSERARELEKIAKAAREPDRIDPTELLSGVADQHREGATVDISVDTDRDICAGTELETAIDELVTNAVTHDPDDHTTVSLSARDDGDWVVVTVADDGPGIPPMEVAVVEAGQETPLEHGKGLGLWLVNWVVTQYGGSFQLSVDDGTVATLRLPAIAADQSIEDAARRPTALLR
ncbi:PAS domain S-box protein [Haloarcula salinisoli]|uniref:PAS domain S-box protein n=1 Tax=Haloarcula salinisoli TaxID=2487746 RepID=A0A8J7YND4_9EURY|nr:PAS domain S-box protein [Halomicroarcula salinisoli]MBX0287040.1 PAS domain S-box protein [Halomicroarcula salinisoli]MBX0304343.1 PAS domain S-box protein [Halomicroarcula salinisoli]